MNSHYEYFGIEDCKATSLLQLKDVFTPTRGEMTRKIVGVKFLPGEDSENAVDMHQPIPTAPRDFSGIIQFVTE
jgi:hypothetical protein